MIKKAWAVWKGGIKDGGGTIYTETGAGCVSEQTGLGIARILNSRENAPSR